MLSYSFDGLSGTPLYEHLYTCIKKDILSETLKKHTKLPSKRSFAANLGVSTITVENAYIQLLSEGYIYSIPKKGYYVSDIVKYPAQSTGESAGRKPAGREAAHPGSGGADFEKASCFADFSSNQTRPENFPFTVWARIMRSVLSAQDDELMTRSPSGGILGLREAIAGHLKQFRGMAVDPDQIIIGAGTEYLYGLLILLLGFDKAYAIENPGYEKIGLIYDRYQVKKHYVDMDRKGIRIDYLEDSGADVVHISPSHHFPTGIVTPVTRRYELLGWASGSDSRYIIEDDYDSEFRLAGRPIPALASIDSNQKVIYINTFTKSLTSTMRISYMVLPKRLLDPFHERLGFYSCTISNFEQFALMRFIKDGHFEKHINRMRNYYHRQRDHLLGAIKKSPLSSLVRITEEDAGLHFLMRIHTKIPDKLLISRAAAMGIRLSCLNDYFRNPPADAEHTFIINYSFIEPDRIEEAVSRIYQCIVTDPA